MKRVGRGFTIVEVSIFLAVTGLLFISITVGVQNSIFQQRYSDAVQGFADFLRNAYSEVLNVQSLGRGDSDLAVYGKMIVLDGQEGGDEQRIRMYTVVGKTDVDCGDNVFGMLSCRDVSVMNSDGALAGIVEEYKPRWGTRIQNINSSSQTDYEGTILIVRNPESGRVYTLTSRTPIDVNAAQGNIDQALHSRLRSSDNDLKFQIEQIDFCVNPNGVESSSRRADVRIKRGASNASGVEVIMDSNDNLCRG